MTDENESEWMCVLQFDDQSTSFAYGFEAGQIWQAMGDRKPLDLLVHGENLELIQRMFVRQNYVQQIEKMEGDGEWYHLRAMPKEYQL